jgi:hypothetical protein
MIKNKKSNKNGIKKNKKRKNRSTKYKRYGQIKQKSTNRLENNK